MKLPIREIDTIKFADKEYTNSPLTIDVTGKYDNTDGYWVPVATFAAALAETNAGGINFDGYIGAFYQGKNTSHVNISLNNRLSNSSETPKIYATGTFKPCKDTRVEKASIQVKDLDGVQTVYLYCPPGGHGLFRLAVFTRNRIDPDIQWLYKQGDTPLLEEPEGELIWDLWRDMSPTPDMAELNTYLLDPTNNNYAQQLINATQENPLDLNDYDSVGVYKCPNQTAPQYISNTPPLGENAPFTLYVLRSTGNVSQIAVRGAFFWVRYRINDVWTDWVRTDLNAIQAGTNITKTIDEQGRVVLSATGGASYTAGHGINIANNVISATGMTKEEILTALGYTEIEISKTDANNNTTTVHVLGRVG